MSVATKVNKNMDNMNTSQHYEMFKGLIESTYLP